jgi:1,4-alpha-glucan branching enzyme
LKGTGKYILVVVFLLAVFAGRSQFNPSTICRVENGRIFFRIDLRWNDTQKKQLTQLFDLDSTLLAGVFGGKREISVKDGQWEVVKLNDHLVEVSKVIKAMAVRPEAANDVFMMDDRWMTAEGESERISASYGVNRFTRVSVFHYANGVATFFLPEHKELKTVFISGSFNGWSTMQSPMTPCDSGWIISMKLKPGKYSYKYIMDGKWSQDPFNKLTEQDTYNAFNSLVFCYNHLFRLAGYPKAKRVILTGSFNSWNKGELKMIHINAGWMLPMYLCEGTHAYKFIVDNEWITDPGNHLKRPDGSGNINSVIGIGDSIVFKLKGFLNAKNVVLAGNFNAWNTGELYMNKTQGGWELFYVLGAGNYEYKFIVDGKWITDPENPKTTGSGDYLNSFMIVKPDYTFKLDRYPEAKKVYVAGSFNGWNVDNYAMVRKDGKWIFPIYLKPGKYTYKFIVDGKWILDPGNELWENNEYGTGNSILWVEP